MDAPAVSSLRKIAAAFAALVLAFSMVPAAWADDAPAGTLASSVAGAAATDDATASDDADAGNDSETPEADMRSADAKAAEGSAGGTTISIAVYRSSFPIVKWDLNDDDYGLTKAEWAWSDRTAELPKDASPGSEVVWPESGKPADYAEPKRAGFEFAGWSTSPSASAGGYIDGSAPTLTMPGNPPESKAYTLYALWTPNEYSVIFDLTKNPAVDAGPLAEDGFSLNWDSADGVRTVKKLANGRYQVLGFTMKEEGYDPTTRTVGLPNPARSGYRFLGWAETDSQGIVQDNAAKNGFVLNPVRLPQIDGTPVLTARWTSAFGVTAPLSITFGDYDKTGAPGNPWLGDKDQTAADDTTQTQQDKEGASEQEGYAKGGHAFFENTGWHEAIKLVGLTSERHASANQVLTSYDTSKASEAAVLGDGTEANPGERLLSLYPSASAPSDDKSSGIHFRLTDAVAEADLGDAFTMAPQGEEGARKEISYGLNLSTDPTDGSANHGLVLPTNDYERKQIATVSYTFATAKSASEEPSKGHAPTATGSTSDDFYIEYQGKVFGPADIKASAECIAAHGTESPCYPLYRQFMASGMNPSEADDPHGYVKWGDGTTYYVRIIGLNYDTQQDGSKAGITFQFVRLLKTPYPFISGGTYNAGGWGSSTLRTAMNSGAIWKQVPAQLAEVIAPVEKKYRNNTVVKGGTIVSGSYDKLFLPAYAEVVSEPADGWVEYWSSKVAERSDASRAYGFYSVNDSGAGTKHSSLIRLIETGQASSEGSAQSWWLRSTTPSNDLSFVNVTTAGVMGGNQKLVADKLYVCPCFAL